MNKEQAAKAKAEWLAGCLSFGWNHSELDDLSRIWDKFKDENGNMKPADESLPGSAGMREALEKIMMICHDGELRNRVVKIWEVANAALAAMQSYADQVTGEGERPSVTDYLGTNIDDIHRAYQQSPDLFKYAQALDKYIDRLSPAPLPSTKGEDGEIR